MPTNEMWLKMALDHFLEDAKWWTAPPTPLAVRGEAGEYIKDLLANGSDSAIGRIADDFMRYLEEAYPGEIPIVQVGLALELALSAVKTGAVEAALEEVN